MKVSVISKISKNLNREIFRPKILKMNYLSELIAWKIVNIVKCDCETINISL